MQAFPGWGLSEAENLNGEQILFWVSEANRLADKKRREQQRGRSNR